MKKLKENWEIHNNWQLIFPIMGLFGLAYSAFRISSLLLKEQHMASIFASTVVIFFLLLKLTLVIFSKLEKKWNVTYRWELISIFIVFAITGSSSVFVSKPIIMTMGITKDNLPTFAYWVLYILIGFIFYQILLVAFGWLFGQYKFFWSFEKKMLRRMGVFKSKN